MRVLAAMSGGVDSSVAAARTVDHLWKAIAEAIDTYSPDECVNYFAAAGYDAD